MILLDVKNAGQVRAVALWRALVMGRREYRRQVTASALVAHPRIQERLERLMKQDRAGELDYDRPEWIAEKRAELAKRSG